MRFNRIKQKFKEDKELIEKKFDDVKDKFKSDDKDEIKTKFLDKTLEKQSCVNSFNDLSKQLLDLRMTKEHL